MDILDINTDVLRQSVSIAKKTNEAITTATNLMREVEVHTDWTCPERYGINGLDALTNKNRKEIEVVYRWSSSFYSAIERASQSFDDCERESIKSFNTLDNLIAAIVKVVPGKFSGSSVTGVGAVLFKGISKALGGK